MGRSGTQWDGRRRFRTSRDALGRLGLGRFGTFRNASERASSSVLILRTVRDGEVTRWSRDGHGHALKTDFSRYENLKIIASLFSFEISMQKCTNSDFWCFDDVLMHWSEVLNKSDQLSTFFLNCAWTFMLNFCNPIKISDNENYAESILFTNPVIY